MNTIIGGVIGLVIFFIGMTLSNGLGLVLGFIAGVLIRLSLITLQWDGVYSIGITGIVLFPGLIGSNPLVLLGLLVGSFAMEPFNAGMKFITNESGSLDNMGSRIELDALTTDGRVPMHMYAFFGLLITITLGFTLILGWGSIFEFFKPIAMPLSILVNIIAWFSRAKDACNKGGGINVGKLVLGLGLSLGISVMSVSLYGDSDLSVYGVILPLVMMGLPMFKKSGFNHKVLPDMLDDNPPVYGNNFITCIMGGLLNSVLISTSQRLVTKSYVKDPYDQYGIEAVCTYLQFGFYWLLGWGKTGESGVLKVIERYQSLDTFFIILLLVLLCGVLAYTLVYTREAMMMLVNNKNDLSSKTFGEVVCICMCVLVVLSSPNGLLGLLMLSTCLLVNVMMRKGIIPGEGMMGALLLPYIPMIS